MKKALFVAILALTPSLGIAMGCSSDHFEASSCPEGQVWSPAHQFCVDQVNS